MEAGVIWGFYSIGPCSTVLVSNDGGGEDGRGASYVVFAPSFR